MILLNDIEKVIIKAFLLSKNISRDDDNSFFSDICARERDLTGVGFFTYFDQLEELKIGKDNETYTFSDLGAKINNSIETGYLVFVKDGFIDSIEGFTYEEPWPKDVTHVEPYSI